MLHIGRIVDRSTHRRQEARICPCPSCGHDICGRNALDLVPAARVAHIGLYREPETFVAIEYFFKAPSDLSERLVIVVVPILATANTAVAAVDRLKERGGKEIRLVFLISALPSIPRVPGAPPRGPVSTAAIDQSLDARALIPPRLC